MDDTRPSVSAIGVCLAKICLIASLLLSCSKKEEKTAEARIPEVPVITVQPQDMPIVTDFVGQTKGSVEATVRARVEGVVQSMNFQEGKEVKEGDLLYTIDPAPLEAQVAEARAKLAEANTRLAKATADLGRIRPLAHMKAVSQKDLDAAVAQEGVARGSVDAAQAGVDAAQINLGYTKITAPVSGVIGLTKAQVGEFVGKPPNPVVLNSVAQLDPINVRFAVNEKDYLFFARAKQKREEAGETPETRQLQLVLSDNSVFSDKGTLTSVDSQIDPTTGSLAAEATFPNPGKILRPGQFAKVRANREVTKGAIIIPKKAIKELQGLRQVLVVKEDNTVELRTITVKEEIGDRVIIDQGLAAGDKLIPEAQQRLASGTKVQPLEQKQVS